MGYQWWYSVAWATRRTPNPAGTQSQQYTKATGPHTTAKNPKNLFFSSSSSCIYIYTHMHNFLFFFPTTLRSRRRKNFYHTHTHIISLEKVTFNFLVGGIYFDHDELTKTVFQSFFVCSRAELCHVQRCIPEKRSHYFNDSILLSVSRARVLLRLQTHR